MHTFNDDKKISGRCFYSEFPAGVEECS